MSSGEWRLAKTRARQHYAVSLSQYARLELAAVLSTKFRLTAVEPSKPRTLQTSSDPNIYEDGLGMQEYASSDFKRHVHWHQHRTNPLRILDVERVCVEALIELNHYWYKYTKISVDIDGEGSCVEQIVT